MDRPLEIAFHNMESSESLESMIRAHVERLDKRHGRLIGCRPPRAVGIRSFQASPHCEPVQGQSVLFAVRRE